MSNDKQSSVEYIEQYLLQHCNPSVCDIEWSDFKQLLIEAKAMHKEEIDYKIQKAIEKFEEAKNKASTLRDIVYLDGVLSILDTIKNETFGGNND